MRMIDLGNQRGPLNIIDSTTSVDCTKDVGFLRSFRTLVECMVPACCGGGFHTSSTGSLDSSVDSDSCSSDSSSTNGSTVTGTFFGYRRGRVSFCLQEDSRGQPLLLLEFTVPTAYLAREMRHGLLRIALEGARSHLGSLFSVPVWTMYCNGRKVGFAVRRKVNESDAGVLKLMRSVSAGAGVLRNEPDGDLMYLRAGFERVVGSPDSESFHMINPEGTAGQELSIFLLRS